MEKNKEREFDKMYKYFLYSFPTRKFAKSAKMKAK